MSGRRNGRLDVLRMIDANANRALEGLRVCEDIVRFHGRSVRAARRLRALRHGIVAAVHSLPASRSQLLAARDARRDVGRDAAGTPAESIDRLLAMNLQRVKESLRVLEESSRLLAPRHARIFQRLRFRTYDVEQELFIRMAPVRHR